MSVVEKAKEIAEKYNCKLKVIPYKRVDRVIITYPDGDKIDLFFEGKLEELGNIALFTIKLLCGGKKTKQSKTERGGESGYRVSKLWETDEKNSG